MRADAPYDEITFKCKPCNQTFKAKPGKVDDAPEREYHPYRYFALCPHCNNDCQQVNWETGLMSMWGKGVPSPTPEARAASAERFRNMEHTPEMNARTRFNRRTHGLYSKNPLLIPQNPGNYPYCRNCEYRDQGCGTWDHGNCLYMVERHIQYMIAFQNGDPTHIRDEQAWFQAGLSMIRDQMVLEIIRKGVLIKTPKYYVDKDGNLRLAEYLDKDGNTQIIYEHEANPVLKPLNEMTTRNNLSLADMRMTPKAKEEEQELAGFIAHREQQDEAFTGFAERQTRALEALTGLIERSRDRHSRDPVLLEHQQEGESDVNE